MKPYSNAPYDYVGPIWFGVGLTNYYAGGAVVPLYRLSNKTITLDFINTAIVTGECANVENNKNSIVWRKIRTGELKTGDTDYAKINLDGEIIDSTYNGSSTIIANVQNSQAEIGRGWQLNDDNRTSNSAIQIIRVYNRDLTDEEVKINYEIDNYRFNIE